MSGYARPLRKFSGVRQSKECLPMKEDQFLLFVKMIASELGYTVRCVQPSTMDRQEILVLEYDSSHFYSFVGINKAQVALEWLRSRM